MTVASYPHAGKPLIKRFAKLLQKKYRDREGLFLAEGLRTVSELMHHIPDAGYLIALLVEKEQLSHIPQSRRYKEKIYLIDSDEARRLSGTSTAQGIVGIFSQQKRSAGEPSSQEQNARELVIALDDVQDPGNVGTILRTASWFGVSTVVCGPGTADRYNPKAIRAGAGSVFCLNHYGVDDLEKELEKMRRAGYQIICSSLHGTDFRLQHAVPEKMVLVIGNEAKGVSMSILRKADLQITIPRGRKDAGVESLNAAVSAAILLSELVR